MRFLGDLGLGVSAVTARRVAGWTMEGRVVGLVGRDASLVGWVERPGWVVRPIGGAARPVGCDVRSVGREVWPVSWAVWLPEPRFWGLPGSFVEDGCEPRRPVSDGDPGPCRVWLRVVGLVLAERMPDVVWRLWAVPLVTVDELFFGVDAVARVVLVEAVVAVVVGVLVAGVVLASGVVVASEGVVTSGVVPALAGVPVVSVVSVAAVVWVGVAVDWVVVAVGWVVAAVDWAVVAVGWVVV